jgi:diacylglycerol kinase family enzyme
MTNSPLKVLVNRERGTAARAGDALHEALQAAFAAAGITADIALLDAGAMTKAIETAAGTERRIVVAGGDGTIASAAQILAGRAIELALLPLGTFNHFARDLGIPTDLNEAAALAAHGEARGIDVGRVNGYRFVNNASIGLYPLMVRQRDAVRKRRGWPKWLATFPAFWTTLSRLPHHRLRVDMGRGEKPLVTPLLFVGNNDYSLERGRIGSRASLQDGHLSVYAVAHSSRAALIWFATRVLAGHVDLHADFVVLGDCPAIIVRSRSGSAEIALDGEVRRLSSPLQFDIEPAALRVVVPARPDELPDSETVPRQTR